MHALRTEFALWSWRDALWFVRQSNGSKERWVCKEGLLYELAASCYISTEVSCPPRKSVEWNEYQRSIGCFVARPICELRDQEHVRFATIRGGIWAIPLWQTSIESKALMTLIHPSPRVYVRYVDDTFTISMSTQNHIFLQALRKQYWSI